MPKSTGVAVEARFAHPIDTVWALLADFGKLPTLVPGCSGVTITGSGIGAVRHVPFEQYYTDERLEVMDHAAHRLVYRVIAKAPVVVREDYVAEMKLAADGPDACRFYWESKFTIPDDADVAVEQAKLHRSYGIAIGGIEAALAAGV